MKNKLIILFLISLTFSLLTAQNRSYLEGNVTLNGGTGNVQEVNIFVGSQITNPDSSGYYQLCLQQGIYELVADLNNYEDFYTFIEIIGYTTVQDIELLFLCDLYPISLSTEIGFYNDVHLTWEDTLGTNIITGHKIYRDSILIAEITNPIITVYYDFALDTGVYSYYVTAMYDSVESERSNIEFVAIFLPAPINLTAIYLPTYEIIILEWESPPTNRDLNFYNIYRNYEIIGCAISTFYVDDPPFNDWIYNVSAVYDGGYESGLSNAVYIVGGVNTNENCINLSTELIGNYPNPFNPSGAGRSPVTNISFSIPEESKIELTVYNFKGQLVKVLVNDFQNAGEHSIIWDGRDSNGNRVSSGIYFYKLNVNGRSEVIKKCLLLK